MRAESVVKPRLFEVDRVGDTAVVSLFDNIREGVTQEDEVGIVFEYDYYSIEIPFREGLELDVEHNYDKWLSMAMNEHDIIELTQTELLQQELFLLKNQVQASSDLADFHEELIVELAMMMYD